MIKDVLFTHYVNNVLADITFQYEDSILKIEIYYSNNSINCITAYGVVQDKNSIYAKNVTNFKTFEELIENYPQMKQDYIFNLDLFNNFSEK